MPLTPIPSFPPRFFLIFFLIFLPIFCPILFVRVWSGLGRGRQAYREVRQWAQGYKHDPPPGEQLFYSSMCFRFFFPSFFRVCVQHGRYYSKAPRICCWVIFGYTCDAGWYTTARYVIAPFPCVLVLLHVLFCLTVFSISS